MRSYKNTPSRRSVFIFFCYIWGGGGGRQWIKPLETVYVNKDLPRSRTRICARNCRANQTRHETTGRCKPKLRRILERNKKKIIVAFLSDKKKRNAIETAPQR